MMRALPIAVASLFLLAFQDTTYSLKEKPVMGAESSYKVNMQMEMSDIKVIIDYETAAKITKVEDDGAYEVESKMTNTKTTFNGEEVAGEDTTETTKYNKDGEEVKDSNAEEDEPDPFSEAVNAVLKYEPKAPVKVGDSWDRETEFGIVVLKLTGTRKEDGVDVLVVSSSGHFDKKDVTAEFKGIHLLRTNDFSLQKSEMSISNAKFDAESEAGKVEIKIERKS